MITRQQTLGIARHILTAIGGIMVTLELTDDGTAEKVIGVAMMIIPIVWSVASKQGASGAHSDSAVTQARMESIVLAIAAGALLCAGCTSMPQTTPINANQWASDYYSQNPTFVSYEMTGVSEIRGTNIHIVSRSYRPPISIIPKEPGVLDKLVELGKWATGFYFGSQVLGKALDAPRTVDPVIVQPEVVTVP